MRSALLFTVSALAVTAAATSSFAQSAEPAPAAAPVVEEIIITAQKREQSLQDVPISVTAVGGAAIQSAGVKDIKDLTVLVPSLNSVSTSSEATTNVRVRGIGTAGDNPGLESSVGVVIDGVYRPRNGVGFGDLGEVERIEVLNGPQGTLFGKNTSAGVINIITASPTFEPSLKLEGTVGNYGEIGGSVGINGPIIDDKLAGRFFIVARKRDGWIDVETAGGPRRRDDSADRNYLSMRGQLLFLPTDNLELRLIGDYSYRSELCCLGAPLTAGPTAAYINGLTGGLGTDQTPNYKNYKAYANRDDSQKVKDGGLSLEANWDINDDLTLTSITAWREWDIVRGSDIDYSGADIGYRDDNGDFGTTFTQFSQELRLAGVAGPLTYVAGLFYAREEIDHRQSWQYGADLERYLGLTLSGGLDPNRVSTWTLLPVGSNFPVSQGQQDQFKQEGDTVALFGNLNWQVTDGLELTLGLRYTHDERSLRSDFFNDGGAPACSAILARISGGAVIPAGVLNTLCAPSFDAGFNNATTLQDRTEKEWGGTFKVAYRFSPDFMTYASYSKGYKGGGFNIDRGRFSIGVINPDTTFAPEFVDAYEVGAKTSLFDRALTLNGAIFYQVFEDYQLNVYTGVSFVVNSLPEVVSRGADLDFAWATPIDGLRISGGVTYAETQAGDFTGVPGVNPNLANSRIVIAPLWSASLQTDYTHDLGNDLELRFNLAGKYTSEMNTSSSLTPGSEREKLLLINGRVTLAQVDDRWALEGWVQNLTDERYINQAFATPNQSGSFGTFLGSPRFYGVTLRLRY
ncbi:MAG: TonB-dependent receptor [Caulobacter sp.]